MGHEQSKGKSTLGNIQGLQIARVLPRSPALVAGLVPFFDIITVVDQIEILDSATASEQFKLYISQRENQQVFFRVYNLRSRAFRDVVCVPSRTWGGGGLLGCSIEWAEGADCMERSWHVVEVLEGGPAHRGGIVAGRHHVIGMQRAEEPLVTLLRDEEDLHNRLAIWRGFQRAALQRWKRRQTFPSSAAGAERDVWLGRLVFLVYDTLTNEVGEVVLDFGEDVDGPLGMNLATGLLHSPLTMDDTDIVVEAGMDVTQDEKDNNGSVVVSGSIIEEKNRASKGVPVMTTFVTPSGNLERLERYTREVPTSLVAEEGSHTPRDVAAKPQLPQSIPTSHTAPRSPVRQSFPPPPLPQLESQETHPQEFPRVAGRESTNHTEASNGFSGIRMPPPFPSADRSAIPIISRSRPTATSGFAEILQHQPQESQPAVEVSSDKKGETGDDAHGIPEGLHSASQPTTRPLPGFPKLPPPLHFPIIRPQTPTQ